MPRRSGVAKLLLVSLFGRLVSWDWNVHRKHALAFVGLARYPFRCPPLGCRSNPTLGPDSVLQEKESETTTDLEKKNATNASTEAATVAAEFAAETEAESKAKSKVSLDPGTAKFETAQDTDAEMPESVQNATTALGENATAEAASAPEPAVPSLCVGAEKPAEAADQPSSLRSSPWDQESVAFNSLREAKAALASPMLLLNWTKQAQRMLRMVDTTIPDVFDTTRAWQAATLSTVGPLCVYFIGETGSGKSTLIKALADGIMPDPSVILTSATTGLTLQDTAVPLPSGIVLVDTRGFRIPVPPKATQSHQSFFERLAARILYSRELAKWASSVSSLQVKVKETDPQLKPPSAVVYVHRAGTRIVMERMVEILSVPLSNNIPTFLILTDLYAVDDEDHIEIRDTLMEIVDQVGKSPRGQGILTLEVNSADKFVKSRTIKALGLSELIAALLNSLRPADVLHFVKRRRIYERPFHKAYWSHVFLKHFQ